MKRFLVALIALVAVPTFVLAAGSMAAAPTILTPDGMKWIAGTGGMKGTSTAVLSGDPSKAGALYAVRIKTAGAINIPPHWHSKREDVTVLSGTLYVGLGDAMDSSKMKALPAGSFVSVPPMLHHYALTKGPAVLEIHGMGPDDMTMVKKGAM